MFACKNKLDRRRALHRHLRPRRGRRPLPGHRPRQRRPRHPHRHDRRPATSSTRAEVFGVDRGPISGVAPGAWVMEYKVCGPAGLLRLRLRRRRRARRSSTASTSSTSRSPAARSPFSDPVELAFLDAYAAGVFVAASAGNEGPGAGTANHLSPWVTTVAASTQTREFATTLTLTAGDGDDLRRRRRVDHRRRRRPAPGGAGRGRPRLQRRRLLRDAGRRRRHLRRPDRGLPARRRQARRVARASTSSRAAARAWSSTTRPWPTSRPTTTGCPPSTWPTAPTSWRSWTSHTGVDRLVHRRASARDGQGDVMAAFSSRGPGGAFVKPDVTAPGVQILAGATPTPPSPTRRRRARPASLPGHRRHVDVVAARRRRRRSCCAAAAPGLDAGPDQVGADDHGRSPTWSRRTSTTPGRPVRHGRRPHRPQRRRRSAPLTIDETAERLHRPRQRPRRTPSTSTSRRSTRR